MYHTKSLGSIQLPACCLDRLDLGYIGGGGGGTRALYTCVAASIDKQLYTAAHQYIGMQLVIFVGGGGGGGSGGGASILVLQRTAICTVLAPVTSVLQQTCPE